MLSVLRLGHMQLGLTFCRVSSLPHHSLPTLLQSHGADAGQAQAALLLEEAWAWGFDVDAWRAHLNALTWPEVAREVAIAAGLGRWG